MDAVLELLEDEFSLTCKEKIEMIGYMYKMLLILNKFDPNENIKLLTNYCNHSCNNVFNKNPPNETWINNAHSIITEKINSNENIDFLTILEKIEILEKN